VGARDRDDLYSIRADSLPHTYLDVSRAMRSRELTGRWEGVGSEACRRKLGALERFQPPGLFVISPCGVEHFAADVAMRVVEPDREDDCARRDRPQEVVNALPVDPDRSLARPGGRPRTMMGKLQHVGFEGTPGFAVEHERDARQLHVRREHDFPDRAVGELMLQEEHARRFIRVCVDEAVLILRGRVNDAGANNGFKESTIPSDIVQIGVELCTQMARIPSRLAPRNAPDHPKGALVTCPDADAYAVLVEEDRQDRTGRPELGQEIFDTEYVISVRVGDEKEDLRDSFGFKEIEDRVGLEDVDHECALTSRQDSGDGITLSNIEYANSQRIRQRIRPWSMGGRRVLKANQFFELVFVQIRVGHGTEVAEDPRIAEQLADIPAMGRHGARELNAFT